MRYFSIELVQRMNSPDAFIREQAEDEWDAKLALYEAELRKHSELPAELVGLDLHDASLQECRLSRDHEGHPPAVTAIFVWRDQRYELRYGSVHRFAFAGSMTGSAGSGGLGGWLTAEITPLESLIRHEVLFESGAVLLCEFAEFSIQRK
jgi:hypothetical protein